MALDRAHVLGRKLLGEANVGLLAQVITLASCTLAVPFGPRPLLVNPRLPCHLPPPPPSHLRPHQCSLANTRAAIAAERPGRVDVRNCSFDLSTNDVGFRLAADTHGVVCHNRQLGSGSLWGRLGPPHTIDLLAPDESKDQVAD